MAQLTQIQSQPHLTSYLTSPTAQIPCPVGVVPVNSEQPQNITLPLSGTHSVPIQEPQPDYRPKQFIDYFAHKADKIKTPHNSIASHLIQLCQDNIQEQINFGLTIIPDIDKSLQNYIQKPTQKEQDLSIELKKSRKIDVSPPPNHQQFIERMAAIRQLNQNKRKQYLEYQRRKKEQILLKQQEQRLKSQEKRKAQKQKKIREKLQELQRRKIKSIQEQKQSIKRYKSVISEKRRHQLMAEKYQKTILHPLEEEQKKKLQQRSQKIKGYSIEQIRQFQREYIKRQQQRLQSEPKKQHWQYTPPPIHPRLAQILEQQKIRERVKLQQKKRALQQKISRQSDYVQYLKESITIKIDEKKKKEMQELTAIKPIIKKSEGEVRTLGNNYLKEIRSKIKKDSKKDNYSLKEESRKAQSHSGQKIKSNTSMGHYQDSISRIRQNRINRLISASTIEKQEKIDKLKLQVHKLNEQAKRKEEICRATSKRQDSDSHLDVLINNIKAKVGIMNLYRD